MALGIRGSNPIWAEFDLTGKIFDDSYYMWVLENAIPYIPVTVYHDPDLNTAWSNPIRFLGNGTLPNDVYFESNVVYRLEFRKNDGLSAPSQSDPLIYLVENYVPGTGGATPVDTLAFASSNQVTNPQFALVNFASPFVVSATDPAPLEIAPGWFFNAAGTGTLTINQVPLNNATPNESNAPYALQLTLTGWTADSVYLSQRFEQNGMLWANKVVSSTITAKLNGANADIGAILVDSHSSTLGTVIPLNTTVNESFNEFTGYADLGATTNPDVPPAAWIEYQLRLPSNIDIYVTSIQLVVQDLPVEPSFEQDSIERQIDHTFHYYQPKINFKPIPSLLTAWDFALNPAQFGASKTITTTPAYIWDQTIAASFSSTLAVNAVPTTGDLELTTNVNNQAFYLMQYLQGAEAAKATFSNLAVNLSAYTQIHGDVTARIYLFYAAGGGNIPTLPTGLGTINADGTFTLTAANWSQITQPEGQASSGVVQFNFVKGEVDIGFNGFDGRQFFGAVGSHLNFAIVVAFLAPTSGTNLIISSISCVPGDIPTRPAPQTQDEVLRECQFYYEMSYRQGVNLPGDITQVDAQFANLTALNQGGGNCVTYAAPLTLNFLTPKRVVPTMTYYSSTTGTSNRFNAKNYGISNASSFTVGNADVAPATFWTSSIGSQCVNFTPASFGALVTQTSMNVVTLYAAGGVQYHYVADARLGVV